MRTYDEFSGRFSGYITCSGLISSRYHADTVDTEFLQDNFEPLIRNEIRKKEIDPISRLETLKEELERQLTAEKLLKNVLGEEEYKTFIREGEIRVRSKKYQNRIYIIRELGKIDVIEIDNSKNKILVERLCINPRDPNFPSQDQLVAKKLGLEEAEELILKTANHFPVRENEKIIEETMTNEDATRTEEATDRGGTFWRRLLQR